MTTVRPDEESPPLTFLCSRSVCSIFLKKESLAAKIVHCTCLINVTGICGSSSSCCLNIAQKSWVNIGSDCRVDRQTL